MYLARDVRDKRGFYKYMGDKRKTRENLGTLVKIGAVAAEVD